MNYESTTLKIYQPNQQKPGIFRFQVKFLGGHLNNQIRYTQRVQHWFCVPACEIEEDNDEECLLSQIWHYYILREKHKHFSSAQESKLKRRRIAAHYDFANAILIPRDNPAVSATMAANARGESILYTEP